MFFRLLFLYFISVHMKFQVLLSTGGVFETFIFSDTSYSLSIEQHLLDNPFVSSANDTGFAWYSKYGGEISDLKFIFHLKYDKGCILNLSLTPLDLNTELVYADGSVTNCINLYPLKEKKTTRQEKPISIALLIVTALLF